jgi:sterol 3beta-glucosyltransferase
VIKEACRRLNVRVIISRGWSKLGGGEPNSADVFYLDDCPHGMESSTQVPFLYRISKC